MTRARITSPRPRRAHRAASRVALALACAAPAARAQAPSPAPAESPRPGPAFAIEGILGWDAARGVVAYVERAPSPLAGFQHAAIVEVSRDPSAAPRRIPLTTDTDVAQLRGLAAGRAREAARAAVEARVARDVDAARARLQPGRVLPVSLRGAAGAGCRRAPFGAREFELGPNVTGRVDVAADATRASVSLAENGRSGAVVEVPSVTLTSAQGAAQAPYDRIADAREVPGTDLVAVLVRSDACTPEGAAVPARAVLLAAPPPPETPLAALPHAEIDEAAAMRALAPRARRRRVDEVDGWFEGRARVVFDNAWTLPAGPGGADRVLVQFTRQGADLPPNVADAGQANASFALVTRGPRGRLRVLNMHSPPTAENVFEGTGQEAFSGDLDGDGRPEVFVRARHGRGDEILTALRASGDAVQYIWRGVTASDDRAAPLGAQAQVRRCAAGIDARTLVVRCVVEAHRANAPPGGAPLAASRVVQRVQWNGGVVNVTEERR